jgi:hypothetical protein
MDPADLCPEAEVSYGELRLSPRLVDMQVLGAGEALRIRVRAATPLDEPFASVQVRIGCAQKLSRLFVLLAEEPAAESLAGAAAPAAMGTPAMRSAPSTASVPAGLPGEYG